MLLSHPSLPVNSLAELVAMAKARPGQLGYASGGNGASTHLAGEPPRMVAGIALVHVPYRGTGPATTDVVAGHVKLMFNGISAGRMSRPRPAGALVPAGTPAEQRVGAVSVGGDQQEAVGRAVIRHDAVLSRTSGRHRPRRWRR
jgi:tripartite-type tricarboxylate transporter receptor subunit TctC